MTVSEGLAAHSREVIRRGSKSFAAASLLFEREIRDHAAMLYAWCRHCDDVVDGQVLGHGPVGRDPLAARADLERLTAQTQAALAGKPTSDPVFASFAHVAATYEIPQRYPLELLEGLRMDVDGRTYESLEDTLEYSYHVAGVVGVMMARVMGLQGEAELRRAADLGLALQLTNIARDVLDDAHGSRVYLPAKWLREAGVPDGRAAEPEHRDAVFSVVRRLLQAAEPYYESARWGLPFLSFRSAWAVAAARDVYREIGILVLAQGPAGMERRTTTTKRRRAFRVLQSAVCAVRAITLDRVRAQPQRPRELWSKF